MSPLLWGEVSAQCGGVRSHVGDRGRGLLFRIRSGILWLRLLFGWARGGRHSASPHIKNRPVRVPPTASPSTIANAFTSAVMPHRILHSWRSTIETLCAQPRQELNRHLPHVVKCKAVEGLATDGVRTGRFL